MNKTAIKNFAIWSRNKLIADVKYRAGLMGITENGIASALPQSVGGTEFYDIGTAEPYAITGDAITQRRKLVDVIEQKAKETNYQTAYKYILEEVAYTWFNRLIAVRFMEVNDYLPSHVRVLSSESGKTEPDLVTDPFNADLKFKTNEEEEIVKLKQENKLDEVFRILFIKQCNALNDILPALFEKTSDYTELLLNLSYIDQDGVVAHLVNDIDEADFDVNRGGQVEIIGWLYQYYNTEPKNEAFAKSGKISKEEIPAVTQLFTPDWIVRYMVENSLGRLWLEGHPNEQLRESWKYYLEEAEQEPVVEAKLAEIRSEHAKLNPEDIKLIDPCMGSGHILVYAFDVLMQIYESAGWSQRDAAKSILENNIYGLDIDDRAGQMAYFAIMMKARQYNRRILSADTPCHVFAIQESNGINRNQLQYFGAGLSEFEKNSAINQMTGLLDTFRDAKEYGSILNVDNYDWELLRRFIAENNAEGQMNFDTIGIDEQKVRLNQLIYIAELMSTKYQITITNPPYMSVSNGNSRLNEYVKEIYPESKADLYSVFIEKCWQMTSSYGYQAMITQHSWMFLGAFEKLRRKIETKNIINMAHIGPRGFDEISGEVVQTTSFVLQNRGCQGYKGTYIRLVNGNSEKEKEMAFSELANRYIISSDAFSVVPGSPIAYWLSENFLKAFEKKALAEFGETREGITTADNEYFLRLWQEVCWKNIKFGCKSNVEAEQFPEKWYPHHKGGEYRKWYGNCDYVVNWKNGGYEVQNFKDEKTGRIRSHNYNLDYIFKEYATWSRISSENVGLRYSPVGFTFDSASAGLFMPKEYLFYCMGFICSCVAKPMLNLLNPTIKIQPGDVADLPVIISDKKCTVEKIVEQNIELSTKDWNSFENSWSYLKNPLTKGTTMGRLIADKYSEWEEECNARFKQLKANEEELNRIFIEIYGLQDELTPEVEDKDVTVRKAELQRDIKSLLSYAVGCMFGRYSLDVEGLAYAGGEWDASKYSSFIPDDDNVIPLTDEEYLEDDIVARLCSWLKIVYGEDTLEENLEFIAKALGNKGDTSRDIIRNYFLNDFFKDHCNTYSVTGSGKRPIYWLFDSGKQNGFKALIYLHRYTADTIGSIRVDYLHRMQRVYESEIGRMQDMIDNSNNNREVNLATKRKEKLQKQLKECRDYDEKISHLALSRIELDLDDGVKVNYRKVQTGNDGKFYEVLADSKNIMAKEK